MLRLYLVIYKLRGNKEEDMVKESSAGEDVTRLAHVVELEKLDVIR